jgi:hypothetical protein
MGRKEHIMISYRTSNARKNLVAYLMCFTILGGMRLTGQVVAGESQIASRQSLSSPPEARSPVILAAINDPHTGKTAFSTNGREDPPVIRAAQLANFHWAIVTPIPATTCSAEDRISALIAGLALG